MRYTPNEIAIKSRDFMISKTIGFFGVFTTFSDTPILVQEKRAASGKVEPENATEAETEPDAPDAMTRPDEPPKPAKALEKICPPHSGRNWLLINFWE